MISGIILAAGTSSRLGRPKQLLSLGDKPLLQHVVDASAASRLDELIVVLGHEAAAIESSLQLPAGARAVVNPDYAHGQASSLRVGVASVSDECEAAVIVLGDQPHMSADLIDRAIEEWRITRSPVVRAMFGGVPGHPVVVARSAFELVERAGGDEGLRSVFADGPEVHDLALGEVPLVDIDTQEQYERVRDD